MVAARYGWYIYIYIYIQWRRKIFFYGDAHTFPVIVVHHIPPSLTFPPEESVPLYSTILKWEEFRNRVAQTNKGIASDHETARFKVHCI